MKARKKPVIVVHGGAGEWRLERQQAGKAGVKEAAIAGFSVLRSGGEALDSVEAAVMSMEDNEAFNASPSRLMLAKFIPQICQCLRHFYGPCFCGIVVRNNCNSS